MSGKYVIQVLKIKKNKQAKNEKIKINVLIGFSSLIF